MSDGDQWYVTFSSVTDARKLCYGPFPGYVETRRNSRVLAGTLGSGSWVIDVDLSPSGQEVIPPAANPAP